MEVNNQMGMVVTGHEDRKLRFWDHRHPKMLKSLSAHSDSVSAIAFYSSRNNYVFHSGGHDGSLRCWDLRNYSLISETQVPPTPIYNNAT